MADIRLTPGEARRLFGLGAGLVLLALGGLALWWWNGPLLERRYPACRLAQRYVALGSSSTVGIGASEPARTGYVALLTADLRVRCPALELRNLGVGGADVARISALLPEIAAARPQLITLFPIYDYWAQECNRGPPGRRSPLGAGRAHPRRACGSPRVAGRRWSARQRRRSRRLRRTPARRDHALAGERKG